MKRTVIALMLFLLMATGVLAEGLIKNVFERASVSGQIQNEKIVIEVNDFLQTPEKNIYDKLNESKEKYNNTYWNHNQKPCEHKNGFENCNYYEGKSGAGIQCHGFAMMLSDELFGKDAKIVEFSDLSKLKVGDIIRYNDRHTMIVTEIKEDYIEVAEANFNHDCKVEFGRKVEKKFLEKCSLLCISRY